MRTTNINLKEFITLAIALISIIIPLYFFYITSPDEIRNQAVIVFIGISIVLLISIPIIYFYSQWSFLIRKVLQNSNEIKKLEKDLKDIISSFELEKRLSIMEKLIGNIIKNKRSQIRIDPRIIIWIILIILLLLFLKTMGVFG